MRTSATTKDIDSKPCKRSAFTESLQSYDLRMISFKSGPKWRVGAVSTRHLRSLGLQIRLWEAGFDDSHVYCTRGVHTNGPRVSPCYTYLPMCLYHMHSLPDYSWSTFSPLEETESRSHDTNFWKRDKQANEPWMKREAPTLNFLLWTCLMLLGWDHTWLFQGCKAMKPWRVSKIEFQKLVDVGCWKGYCT